MDASQTQVDLDSTATLPALETHPRGLPAPAEDEVAMGVVRENIEARLFGRREPSLIAGRFVLEARLGAGGMGSVWRAHDRQLDRRVAIKFILPTQAESQNRIRLLREAQALARIAHPNVIPVFDFGSHEDQVWVAMEYVPGRNLREWMLEVEPSAAQILEAWIAVGRGLAAVHRAGLVHRDVKPSNVLVGDDGRVRLIDFGLVRLVGSELETEPDPRLHDDADDDRPALEQILTRRDSVVGTPAYMSPEQAEGFPVDERGDQFSFCVALWEGVYGERPYHTTSLDTLRETLSEGRLQPPPADARGPRWLQPILERGLSVSPEQRWRSIDELLDALTNDPTRRRRRRIAVAGVLTLALTGAGLFAYASERDAAARAAVCDAEGRGIEDAWNDRVRADLDAKFSADAVSESSWRHARDAVDAYAAQWTELRTRTCAEASLEDTRDDARSRRVADCLDSRRAVLGALVSTWPDLAPGEAHRVVTTAFGLPPLEVCVNDRWLSQHEMLPEDRANADAIAQLRRQLHVSAGLRLAARNADALELGRHVLDRARALAWDPLIAEAEHSVGASLLNLGRSAEARPILEQAYYRAASAGHDRVAFDAAHLLVHALGVALEDPEAGMQWAAHADVMLARLDRRGSSYEASLLNNRANVECIQGEHARALESYTRARAIREASFGPDHPRTADVLNNIGAEYVELQRFADAILAYQRALEIRERTLGREHPRVVRTLLNLGSAHWRAGATESALATYARALAIEERTANVAPAQLAHTLNAIGDLREQLGQYAEAASIHRRALSLREATLEPDDPALAQSLDNLGDALVGLRQYAEARESYRRALDVAAQTRAPDDPYLARLHTQIGEVEVEVGLFEEALASFEHALHIHETAREPDVLEIAEALDSVGQARALLGDPEAAILDHRRSLALREAALGPDHHALAEPLGHLARRLTTTGELDQALAAAERARELEASATVTRPHAVDAALVTLAEVALERGELARARELAEDAIARLEPHDADERVLADARFVLARVAWATRDHARALELARLAADALAGDDGRAGRRRQQIEGWLSNHTIQN